MQTNYCFGQCFLNNEIILDKIASTIDINNRKVIEIGAGTGHLSKFIVQYNPSKFTMYEIDVRFKKILEQIHNNVVINDILHETIDTDVIISNLPYNISTPFCKKLLLEYKWNECMLLLQKEFVDKIMRNDNILGLMFSLTCKIKVIRNVSKNNFQPRPTVNSTVIYIKNLHNSYDKNKLWTFADKLFSKSRKKLGNEFAPYENLRSSKLTISQIIALYNKFNIQK